METDPAFGTTQEARDQLLYRGGLTVQTALNPTIEKTATKVAQKSLDAKGNPATAIAIVQPGTGHVPAIATNRSFGSGKGETEIILPVTPSFQPG
jgi:membrane peptidoglycan carboxypeptidase